MTTSSSTLNPQETLALHGGPPVRRTEWTSRRVHDHEERDVVVALMEEMAKTGQPFTYGGPEEKAYTEEFAAFQGGGFADAVNSGSNALYIALRALQLEAGSEVIISPVSDPGGVMPVPLAGFVPVPADSAPGSFNIGAEEIRARITPRTRAVIVTHIAGIPADMDAIMEVAREHDLRVIEDCAQAHGALYHGTKVGNFGHVGCFSTMYGKHHVTGGQGGLTFTRSEELSHRLRRHADRGKTFKLPGAVTDVAALNCNSDELHCAMGRVQLRKLPGMIERRREIARRLARECAGANCFEPVAWTPDNGTESAHWFLFFRFHPTACTVDKAGFVEALSAEGLPFSPSYDFPTFQSEWFKNHAVFEGTTFPWTAESPHEYEMPNIEACLKAFFKLNGFHESLTDADVEDLIRGLRKVDEALALRTA